MQQLLCGWPPLKMGVEAEEEGGPAEEEDAARAMEPLDAGAAGSSWGVRLPGDGGKGREGWRGRAGARGGRWGAASRSRSGLASTGTPRRLLHAWATLHSCTHGWGAPAPPRGPLVLPAAPSRRLGGPCPFRRRDLASVQVGKEGPGSSKTVWSPLGTHFHPSLWSGLVAPGPALNFQSLTSSPPPPTEKLWRICYFSNINIFNISLVHISKCQN